MDTVETFDASLEVVAERCEDPVPRVYELLFERYPEMEKLFVLDTDYGARGHMLNEALTCARDILEGDGFAGDFLTAERSNHEGYGITDDMFKEFYDVVRTVFREIAANDWTASMDQVWQQIEHKVAQLYH